MALRTLIAGNWKMHRTASEAGDLVRAIRPAADGAASDVVVCPPFTSIPAAAAAAAGSRKGLGAQDLFWKDAGAYTGHVSPPMLTDLGVRYVITGHSERRGRFGVPEADTSPESLTVFGDNDVTVRLKTAAALRHELTPILCCGETLGERRAGRTDALVRGQVAAALAGLTSAAAARVVVAYEPVWAIGTGETCEAEEANRVCGVIRAALAELFGVTAAGTIRILYGGSVKPGNAAELLGQPEINGALVGGASLNASDFNAIIGAAG